MGAIAMVAIGSFILLLVTVAAVVVLCHWALRRSAEFEAEIKVASAAFRIRMSPLMSGQAEALGEVFARQHRKAFLTPDDG